MENTIEYQGKLYPTRTFEAYICDETEDDSRYITIASSLLSDAMGDNILVEGSIEEQIDNKIYYYVDEAHLSYDAETICLECLDEAFILMEEIN